MGRMDKVNRQMVKEISLIIHQELADPRLQFVSILRVDVSLDLRNAKIYFSALGEEKQIKDAANALDRAKGLIRKMISKSLNLRYTPELMFLVDQSISASARLEETFQEINDELQENNPDDQEA